MTGASKITLTVYPIIIFVTFIIIKVINLRLHHMFDGEESNELESNKDKDIEEGNTGSINASINDGEAKRTEEIELDVLKKPQSESSETKCDDEEITAEKETSSNGNADGNTNGDAVSCNPANPVRTILEEADDYELEEGEVRFLPMGAGQDNLEVIMFLIISGTMNGKCIIEVTSFYFTKSSRHRTDNTVCTYVCTSFPLN